MCLFCQIVKKEIPAQIVYEDKNVLAFKDIKPQAPVHILVIPKQHIPSLAEVQAAAVLGDITRVIQQLVKAQKIDQTGYRVVTNVGPDSGQAVEHLHFHLLGGRKMTWPPG